MRIDSSSITMTGTSHAVQQYTKEESLKTWVGDRPPNFENTNTPNQNASLPADILQISEKGKSLLSQDQLSNSIPVKEDEEYIYELSDREKQKIDLIQKFIQSLTGKKIKFIIPEKIGMKHHEGLSKQHQPAAQLQPGSGWGLEYDLKESYHEIEKMSFSSSGIIKTSDGREINFNIQLNMDREFAVQNSISIRAGNAKTIDPLVINYDSNVPELTDLKFSFDIDSDGNEELISFAKSGSGFLAIDSNNDGKINNGSELFGPNTGNGFEELSLYDSDSNNWIDENDPIYDKLKIWCKDEDGSDKLFVLGQKGIGAIYLGNVDTGFDIKDGQNNLNGRIQKTGVFLRENGTAGTIQHIDLAI